MDLGDPWATVGLSGKEDRFAEAIRPDAREDAMTSSLYGLEPVVEVNCTSTVTTEPVA